MYVYVFFIEGCHSLEQGTRFKIVNSKTQKVRDNTKFLYMDLSSQDLYIKRNHSGLNLSRKRLQQRSNLLYTFAITFNPADLYGFVFGNFRNRPPDQCVCFI